MSAPESQNPQMPLACPSCGRLIEVLVINPAGELIGCEECADAFGLAGGTMSLDEWNATEVVNTVLERYALTDWIVSKPAPTETQHPRAHYWVITSGSRRYFLKRFHDWYPSASIRYTHSLLTHLAGQALPVPRWVPDRSGASYTELGGACWALYEALPGKQANEREWMWGRPKAAEMLATLHVALEGFAPEGEPFQPWNAWTLETVDRVLESWPPHTDLSPHLLEFVRERLAVRYFGSLYPELPKLVVHGDYVASNVLWRGEAVSANICGILDFERAHPDTALFDFAWGLGDRRPPLLRATVATYSRVRPLSPIEREAMPEALLLGGLMGIDMQMTYFGDMEEVTRLAQDLAMLIRDLEPLRKAVALKAAPVR
ncbi:MAG: phosphotransferase [Ktedonobacterales bacterium]|nr:phosphotransferase [Ktedonobacterales bacterium]